MAVVLPQLPVERHHRDGETPAPGPGQVPQGLKGVGHGHRGGSSGEGRDEAVLAPGPLCHHHPPHAPAESLGYIGVAVMAFAHQGHKKLAGLAGAGVGADPHESVLRPALEQNPPAGGDEIGGGKGGRHQPWYSFKAWATSSVSSKWMRSSPQIW